MDPHAPYRMLIDGQLLEGEAGCPIVDPATEEVFAHAPDCSPQGLEQAIAAAARAFPAWRDTPLAARRALLVQMAPRIEPHLEALAQLLTREQGKPLAFARLEVGAAVRWLAAQATMEIPEIVNEDSAERRNVTRYVPLGVVAAISPWNFPVLLSWWKVMPALLTGNTVVLKPSPLTPLTVLRIAELLADLLPPGVLNVVSGGDHLGPLLSAHPAVAKVSFTGSTVTGQRVMQGAASGLKRLTLELGGNDAAIVLPDVDVQAVAPQLFWSCFANSGQICIATKRLFVHRRIHAAFTAAFVAYARTVKVGPGLAADSQLGPVQNRRQFERVRALIEETRAAGHPVLFESEIPAGPGYYVPITVFDNPPDDSRLVAEEPFGPVLPILSFDTVDEAIRRANDSPYGLAGSVWSQDLAQAEAIARRLETGTVWINEFQYLHPMSAFAGHKMSGYGVENGVEGTLAYTVPQTLSVKKT